MCYDVESGKVGKWDAVWSMYTCHRVGTSTSFREVIEAPVVAAFARAV